MSCKLSRRARTFSANSTALVSWKAYTTDPTKDETNWTYISHCWRSIDGGTKQNRMFGSIINEFNESLCAFHHGRSNSQIFFNSSTLTDWSSVLSAFLSVRITLSKASLWAAPIAPIPVSEAIRQEYKKEERRSEFNEKHPFLPRIRYWESRGLQTPIMISSATQSFHPFHFRVPHPTFQRS